MTTETKRVALTVKSNPDGSAPVLRAVLQIAMKTLWSLIVQMESMSPVLEKPVMMVILLMEMAAPPYAMLSILGTVSIILDASTL